MPTIVDSIFIELGVDTSKFTKDQQRAIAKIQQFESQVKQSAGKARGGIQTVGDAFGSLAKDSRIGASANSIENMAKKFTALGMSLKLSGGAGGEGLGGMAMGLGRLLSPAALGAAAVGLLGKEMWDLNKVMTDVNATIDRQSQLSGMNAKSLWSWGEAAKTVGANPQDITGGISSVQTAIAGMMIGAGDATPQLVALARLGLGWNAQSGLTDAQVTQMFTKVHQKAAAQDYKNLGALRALTGPIMNDAMFALATSPNFDPSQLQKQIQASAPANLNKILQDSLKSQMALGQLGIDKDIIEETAYGGEQGLMMSVVTILRDIAGGVAKIANRVVHPIDTTKKVWNATVDAVSRGIDQTVDLVASFAMRGKMSSAMRALIDHGVAEGDAAAMVGSAARESSMNPLARNASGHVGLFQLNKARAANFAKWAGYSIGDSSVSAEKQFSDQLMFALQEPEYKAAAIAMAKAKNLMGKTKAFMDLDERPGDNSLGQRFGFAMQADQLANLAGMLTAASRRADSVQHNISSQTKIDSLTINTPTTDPKGHADAFRKGISTHPLMNAADLSTLGLATRGTTQ